MNHVFAGPVGPGESRRYGPSILYAASATAGGGALGLFLMVIIYIVGLAPVALRSFLSVLLAFGAFTLQAVGRMAFLPQSGRQVPQRWNRLGPYQAAMAFGATLGLGITTRLVYPVAYSVLAGLLITGEPVVGFVVGVAFGMTRGLVPIFVQLVSMPPNQYAKFESFLAGGRYRRIAIGIFTPIAALMFLVVAIQSVV